MDEATGWVSVVVDNPRHPERPAVRCHWYKDVRGAYWRRTSDGWLKLMRPDSSALRVKAERSIKRPRRDMQRIPFTLFDFAGAFRSGLVASRSGE